MLFGHNDRYDYTVSPLIEVICQLRFPTILSIGATDPVAFQEAIRGDFPRYAAQKETPPPKVVNPGTPKQTVQQQAPVTNYNFISTDGRWKINLTSGFIALSTKGYPGWEGFAAQLDRPLGEFINIYKPAFFERIGLRYINAVSRKRLGLEGTAWSDLIQPAYLGILGELDVEEPSVTKCATDAEVKLDDGYHLKIHAGPGLLGDGKQDPEPRFILDGDFSTAGTIAAAEVPVRLETMHDYATRFFRGAITSELHTAMGPI